MNRIFNPDAPVMQFLSRMADLIMLNVLWVILCIPIVTVGAATTALYRVCLNMIAGTDGSLFRDFFRAFRSNFKPATLTWLILLVPLALCCVNLWLLLGGSLGTSIWMTIICVLPLLVVLFLLAYVFAYIAAFENTILMTLRNALLLSLANAPKTILMVALNLLPLILFFFATEFFFRSSIFWLLIGFALVMYLDTRLIWGIFKRIAPEIDPATRDTVE